MFVILSLPIAFAITVWCLFLQIGAGNLESLFHIATFITLFVLFFPFFILFTLLEIVFIFFESSQILDHKKISDTFSVLGLGWLVVITIFSTVIYLNEVGMSLALIPGIFLWFLLYLAWLISQRLSSIRQNYLARKAKEKKERQLVALSKQPSPTVDESFDLDEVEPIDLKPGSDLNQVSKLVRILEPLDTFFHLDYYLKKMALWSIFGKSR